jgi:hypothetical protein
MRLEAIGHISFAEALYHYSSVFFIQLKFPLIIHYGTNTVSSNAQRKSRKIFL